MYTFGFPISKQELASLIEKGFVLPHVNTLNNFVDENGQKKPILYVKSLLNENGEKVSELSVNGRNYYTKLVRGCDKPYVYVK